MTYVLCVHSVAIMCLGRRGFEPTRARLRELQEVKGLIQFQIMYISNMAAKILES